MPRGQDGPDRQTTRISDYDYSQPGYYAITICAQNHKIVFGTIVEDQMRLNKTGSIASTILQTIPERFPGVEIDAWAVMPNHLHLIVVITKELQIPRRKVNVERVPERFKQYMQHTAKPHQQKPEPWQIIRTLKAAAAYRIRKSGLPNFAWQERYYMSIIPNDNYLENMRLYIANNPAQWALDKFHPDQLHKHGHTPFS